MPCLCSQPVAAWKWAGRVVASLLFLVCWSMTSDMTCSRSRLACYFNTQLHQTAHSVRGRRCCGEAIMRSGWKRKQEPTAGTDRQVGSLTLTTAGLLVVPATALKKPRGFELARHNRCVWINRERREITSNKFSEEATFGVFWWETKVDTPWIPCVKWSKSRKFVTPLSCNG